MRASSNAPTSVGPAFLFLAADNYHQQKGALHVLAMSIACGLAFTLHFKYIEVASP
jgi:hypothetical protein